MSVYTEFELRCDCGLPGDKFGCDPAIYASRKEVALREAKESGWTTRRRDGRTFHYRPGHDPSSGGIR
jgi:hypothetical protein